jgi:hypothetical protein
MKLPMRSWTEERERKVGFSVIAFSRKKLKFWCGWSEVWSAAYRRQRDGKLLLCLLCSSRVRYGYLRCVGLQGKPILQIASK